ncbi:MAG: small multi-drug export protein [Candidatus Hadarchaeum sp.]
MLRCFSCIGGILTGLSLQLMSKVGLPLAFLDVTRWWQGIPAPLRVVLISIIPIVELRGAIPVAMVTWEMSWTRAYLWAVLGNMIPIPLILTFLDPVSTWLMERSRLMDRFFKWLFQRTRKKHSHAFERWRDLALCLFVAVPLPGTGAWTGALAAFLFGIPFSRAIVSIFSGVLIAGAIVTSVTYFFQQLPGWFTAMSAGILAFILLAAWLKGKSESLSAIRQTEVEACWNPTSQDADQDQTDH